MRQIIGADGSVVIVNQELNCLEIEQRSIAMYNPQNYESHTLTVREFAVRVMYTALQYGFRTGCEIL